MLFCTNTRESSQQVYNLGKALGSELVPSTRGLSLSEPRALPKDWQGRSRRKEPLQPGATEGGWRHRGWHFWPIFFILRSQSKPIEGEDTGRASDFRSMC